MRGFFEPVNRAKRAELCRQAAIECERKGFGTIARINWEMAAYLDPPKPEPVKEARRIAPVREEAIPTRPTFKARPANKLGADVTRINGQRDGRTHQLAANQRRAA